MPLRDSPSDSKHVFVLAGAEDLLARSLRDALVDAGVERLQVNVRDHEVEGALALQHLPERLDAVVSTWGGTIEGITAALAERGRLVGGWAVEERVPLAAPPVADGVRADALANVALIRRPAEMSYDDWLAHWWGRHTEVAMATQATFGYVQNRVLAAVVPGSAHVDALVEELFPAAAVADVHAFYGSGGDDAELGRRITELMESVALLGADRDIDLVPTGRYVVDLAASDGG